MHGIFFKALVSTTNGNLFLFMEPMCIIRMEADDHSREVFVQVSPSRRRCPKSNSAGLANARPVNATMLWPCQQLLRNGPKLRLTRIVPF
jgi:hypothetical protein